MKNTIKIHEGKLGFFLVVNGFAIKRNFVGEIKASYLNGCKANNWVATEWDSIKSMRSFWNEYKYIISAIVESSI